MSDADTVLERWELANKSYSAECHFAPHLWHRPDVQEFVAIRNLLIPLAEAGNAHCQYYLAWLYFLCLTCESEAEYHANCQDLQKAGTPWLLAAAKQGHPIAIDNLMSIGVGPEVEQIRALAKDLRREFDIENETPDRQNWPIAFESERQLYKRLCGREFTNLRDIYRCLTGKELEG